MGSGVAGFEQRIRGSTKVAVAEHHGHPRLAAVYDTGPEAESFLRQAVKLDPRFAAAHAMLGIVEILKFFWVFYSPDYLHSALKMAKTALELDPDEA